MLWYRNNSFFSVIIFLSTLYLSSCDTLPRGAPLQKEIMDSASVGEDNFIIHYVTGDFIQEFDNFSENRRLVYNWQNLDKSYLETKLVEPGDYLSVSIWDSTENSLLTSPGQRVVALNNIHVSQSGEIFLPYIGLIKVSNLTASEARSRLENSLKAISQTVQVQLSITQRVVNTVEILSGVSAPGNYQLLNENMSVLDLLAISGGVITTFKNPQLMLHRDNELYRTSISSLYENPTKDIELKAGDKLIVKEDDRYFLSLGATGKEDQHIFNREQVFALDAIAMTGGVADNRADLRGLLILRENPKSLLDKNLEVNGIRHAVFVIDLTTADGLFAAKNFEIFDQDIIFATESPITSANTVLNVFGRFLGIARNVQNL